jgi:hypothetical protein
MIPIRFSHTATKVTRPIIGLSQVVTVLEPVRGEYACTPVQSSSPVGAAMSAVIQLPPAHVFVVSSCQAIVAPPSGWVNTQMNAG